MTLKIYLIPKQGIGETVENLVETTRPIAICHEYAKLFSKLLANRLSLILANHKVLHPAQQAFIKNGSINHCIITLLNIFEDAKQKREGYYSDLYFIAYDFKKAYDSIQYYSLRPTLERFNLPEKFIQIIENIQSSLSASIKTFHGLTESFMIENSLRQGDPLAPLIFVLFTDVLHEGLSKSPLYLDQGEPMRGGYRFLSNDTRISSLGFADDLGIVAESWPCLFAMHEWVREFISVHGGDLNTKKTSYIAQPEDDRWLRFGRSTVL